MLYNVLRTAVSSFLPSTSLPSSFHLLVVSANASESGAASAPTNDSSAYVVILMNPFNAEVLAAWKIMPKGSKKITPHGDKRPLAILSTAC